MINFVAGIPKIRPHISKHDADPDPTPRPLRASNRALIEAPPLLLSADRNGAGTQAAINFRSVGDKSMGISPEEFFAIVRAGIAGQALSGEQDRGMTVGTESCCWRCHVIRAFAPEKSMSNPLDAILQTRDVWRDEFSFRVSMRDRSTFRAATPLVGAVAVRVRLTGILAAAAAIKTPDIAPPYVAKRNWMPLRVVRTLSDGSRRKRKPPRSETGFESGEPVHFAKTGIEPFFTNFKDLTYFLAFE